MPQKGDAGILGRHAAAVVGHTDHGGAAVPDLDRDLVGTGVKGVFHQFLDDRGRALDHLAGGDQVGNMGR